MDHQASPEGLLQIELKELPQEVCRRYGLCERRDKKAGKKPNNE